MISARGSRLSLFSSKCSDNFVCDKWAVIGRNLADEFIRHVRIVLRKNDPTDEWNKTDLQPPDFGPRPIHFRLPKVVFRRNRDLLGSALFQPIDVNNRIDLRDIAIPPYRGGPDEKTGPIHEKITPPAGIARIDGNINHHIDGVLMDRGAEGMDDFFNIPISLYRVDNRGDVPAVLNMAVGAGCDPYFERRFQKGRWMIEVLIHVGNP